jgi:hypothetical protein
VTLGYSHAKGLAARVKHLLSSDFEVFESINPGVGIKILKDTASVKVQKLTKKDILVLWGGSNGIARNNSLVGLKHILEFLISTNNKNVILMTAPHRHDLITTSCVNKEVEVFNKKFEYYLLLGSSPACEYKLSTFRKHASSPSSTYESYPKEDNIRFSQHGDNKKLLKKEERFEKFKIIDVVNEINFTPDVDNI